MLNTVFVPTALGLQLLMLLLLQDALSWWSSLVITLILVFKALRLRSRQAVPMRILNGLALLLCALLLSQLQSQDMQNSMLQLLFFSAALRLCSVTDHGHHAKKLVWVHYFLIATAFMLNQNLLYASAVFLLFFSNLYLHYLLFAPVQQSAMPGAEARLLFWVLPFGIALFVLFPRLPPVWQNERQLQAQTGLANQLSLGGLEQLVQDDSLAFRAEFFGEKPPQQELYWRAKVFELFDGQDWLPGPQTAVARPAGATARYHYQIVVEPHFQRSLFSLGQLHQLQGQVRPVAASLVESRQRVNRRFSYSLHSDGGSVPLSGQSEARRNVALQHTNPKASRLAAELTAANHSPDAYARALYRYFQQQQFSYSLRPPVLDQQAQIDQFLFQHKIGFCGHYAAAAAYLFRAAGIPARVVGGYQGGTWQAGGDYVQVLQKDAHAWVEYLDQDQWKRFDATAIVAPLRLTQSLAEALSLSERHFLAQLFQQGLMADWLQQLEWLDYYWSVWVLSFDQTEQRIVWQQFLSIPWLWLASTLGLFAALLLLLWLRPDKRLRNSHVQLRRQLLALFGPVLQKQPEQSIEAYLMQISERYPAHYDKLTELLQAYQRFEFGEQQEQLQRCRTLLRELKKSGLGTD